MSEAKGSRVALVTGEVVQGLFPAGSLVGVKPIGEFESRPGSVTQWLNIVVNNAGWLNELVWLV